MIPLTDEEEQTVLVAIGAITIVSGATQALVPGVLLRILKVEDTRATRQLFGTVGMFMVVVGGLMVDGLRRPSGAREVAFWAGAQKLGASAAVALGVSRSVFAKRALLVAGFDFASGLVALDYWRRLPPS
jgi:MFS-type transporter involved in bile tolerance (Atg22 family)